VSGCCHVTVRWEEVTERKLQYRINENLMESLVPDNTLQRNGQMYRESDRQTDRHILHIRLFLFHTEGVNQSANVV
jgi:hypothetical protein